MASATPKLRLYVTTGEYFVCESVSLFIKRFNSFGKDVDVTRTIKGLRVARDKELSLKYNRDLNVLLFDVLKLEFR